MQMSALGFHDRGKQSHNTVSNPEERPRQNRVRRLGEAGEHFAQWTNV